MQVPELLIQALPVPIQFHIFPGCTAGKIKSMQKTPRRGGGWVGGVVLSIRDCDRDKELYFKLQVIKLFTNY